MTQDGRKKAELMIVCGRESCRLIWVWVLRKLSMNKPTEQEAKAWTEQKELVLRRLREVRQ